MLEKLLAGRWVAGATIDDGLNAAMRINKNDASAILNYLGEDIKNIDDINATKAVYLKLIEGIKKKGLDADISLKPTELGLEIDKTILKKNYIEILKYAKENEIFVWLDMEQAAFVSDTISLYKSGIAYGNAGICIQAYLRRSISDLKALARLNSTIRLVKGAYSESPKIAYPSWADVTSNYSMLMNYLFANFTTFTIATHDKNIIERAMAINKKYDRDITYAMLNGVRNRYAYRLANEGNKVAIYVPFGTAWFRYAFRRLREEGGSRRLLSFLMNFRQN